MKYGFIKTATAAPRVRVADPAHNVGELIRITQQAETAGVRLLVFPELCLTGATCADLFFSETLLSGAASALNEYLTATANTDLVSIVGLPVCRDSRIYDAAAVCHAGKLLGVVPRSYISARGESTMGRAFSPAPQSELTLDLCDSTVPFGKHLLFCCDTLRELCIAVETGEDLLAPCPPSIGHTAAGATVVCNPTASSEAVGRQQRRRMTVTSQSARTVSAYLYASAGAGESTTDAVFGGHCMIAENGRLLAERLPLSPSDELLVTEIDVQRLAAERRRTNQSLSEEDSYRRISFSLTPCETQLTRSISPRPFIPADPQELADRCEEIIAIQTEGLRQRVERAFAKKLVLGISGGLDSTLALLVAVRAMDALKRPRTDVIAVTMPCFGTTKRTKNNATVLCEELGVDFRCIDIFDAVNLHFRDIGHDPSLRDVTYENCQARERTQVLMDVANDCGGMVVGTGDLSELALGWATYNGDHMSMYGVNADVPKTLIRHLVAQVADRAAKDGNARLAASLRDVLDTPVSPELLPANENGEIAQKTEDLVGPYEIHDFYLYYLLRFGFSPAKLYHLAKHALGGTYDEQTLKKWLRIFVRRFFAQQFKRSCSPDGPKVGSVSLSPRGAWQMPSDAASELWMREIDQL